MEAIKIKMEPGCVSSNNLLEIYSIYLIETKNDGFYKEINVHGYLMKDPGGIQVNIYPYSNLIPRTSPAPNYEKNLDPTSNNTKIDNLLSLSRE